MKLPDDDTVRLVFGYLLVCMLAGLASAIAMGSVTEKESFGLQQIVTGLAQVLAIWAAWAFQHRNGKDKDDK